MIIIIFTGSNYFSRAARLYRKKLENLAQETQQRFGKQVGVFEMYLSFLVVFENNCDVMIID